MQKRNEECQKTKSTNGVSEIYLTGGAKEKEKSETCQTTIDLHAVDGADFRIPAKHGKRVY